MSKNDNNALNNAEEIIERFGGIRPMAAKIDTPVTTVQGWKKRGVIPGTRRDQIMAAASENDIDLSDLANGSSVANQNAPKQEKPKSNKPVAKTVEAVAEPRQKSAPTASQDTQQAPSATHTKEHDDLLVAIEVNNRKTMVASAWIATGLILLATGVAAFLLWPNMQQNTAQLEAQSDKMVALESDVEDVRSRASFIKNFIPEDIQTKMDDLQTQAQNIQNTVQQLSETANEISSGVLGADAGPLSQRLMVLEEKMAELSGGDSNFAGLISRIRSLEDSIPGQEQLKSSVDELRSMVEKQDIQNSLNQDLAEAQNDEAGALSQTLEGVSGNDLKAAAMLIAFSQLRDSLNRQEPFENDLMLLEKLAGEDNPELLTALGRLAPHADGGILTAKGLSGEFKGLAGDIVVSSLKGEDISFKEKARARLSDLLKVEKEGELVTGTETQLSVSKAQKLLDAGDIQAAIAELQTLDGEAAQTAQPFIAQAQVSLLSEKVQQLLGEDILSKISSQMPIGNMLQGIGIDGVLSGVLPPSVSTSMVPPNGSPVENSTIPVTEPSFSMDAVKDNLENALPFMDNQEVIRDEESGITILPSQPGFKGFSSGQ